MATVITNATELQNMANDLSEDYELANDIDLNGVNWTPVGDASTPFTGTFDGKGYTISNLAFDLSSNNAVTYYGLFGCCDSVTLTDVVLDSFNFKFSGASTEYYYYGALSAKVISATISKCYVADILIDINDTGKDLNYVGGLIGFIDG